MSRFLRKVIARIKQTENIQNVFKSLALLLSEKFLRVIVGFFITALIARHLGPISYGKYTFIIQYVLIFIPIVSFGMNELISRDLVKGSEYSEGQILGTSFALKLFNAFLGVIVIVCSASYLDLSQTEQYFLIGFSLVLFIQVFAVVDHWFEARLEYRKLVIARNIGYLASVVLKIYFLVFEFSFEYFIITYFVELLVSRILSFYIYYKINGISSWCFSRELLKRYYLESFPLFLVSGLTILEQKIGFLFVKKSESSTVLGHYSLAFTMFNILLFVPNAIVTTLYPTIIRSKERSHELYEERVSKLFMALMWTSFLFFISFYLIGGNIFLLVFGDKYYASVEILKVMILLLVFISFDTARRKIMILEEKGSDYLLSVITYTFFSVVMQYYLVKNYSAIGIVYASIYSFILSNVLVSLVNKNIRQINANFIKGIFYPLKKVFR